MTLNILREGSAIGDGVYQLRRFTPNAQYLDPTRGWRIRSVGQRISDNRIFAAVDLRYANDPNYSCLYSEA